MADPQSYILDLKGQTRPPKTALPEVVVKDIDWFNAHRASERAYDAVLGIEGVVIHATAGSTSGGALQHWRTAGQASAHWIVPGEKEAEHGKSIIACVYEARAAWHVRPGASNPEVDGGRNLINHWTLGIEIVNTQNLQDYSDPYSAWQVEATAAIVRYCWAKYPNLRWVFSHAAVDPKRRADPGKQFPWKDFEKQVLKGGQGLSLVPVVAPAAAKGDAAAKPCCGMDED